MASTSVGPNYILDKTFLVATGYTITGYQVVAQGSTAGTCNPPANDASPFLGVAQLDPNEGVTLTAGKTVRVRMMGITKAQAGAAITTNTPVSVLGTLGLVDDITPGTVGDYWVGVALEAASQLGDIITIDLTNKNSRYAAS